MKRPTLIAIVVLKLSFGLLSVAALEGWRELEPYFAAGTSIEGKFAAIVSQDYSPGSSTWSKGLLLEDCRTVSRSNYAKAQTTPRRNALLARCRDFSEQAVAEMPSYSEAWALAAEFSGELGDLEGLTLDLVRAQQTAPNVHWLAAERVNLAERHFDSLGDAGKAAHKGDIRALLDSDAGTRFLADRFVRELRFRKDIEDVVLSGNDELQERFLRYVSERVAEE